MYCPLFAKLHNIQEITPKYWDFGMCIPQRKLISPEDPPRPLL